jgi:hypothetical protein
MNLPGKQKLTEGFKKRPRPQEEIEAINVFRAGFGDNVEIKEEEKEVIHVGQLQNSLDFKKDFDSELIQFFVYLFIWASNEPLPGSILYPGGMLINLNQESPGDFESKERALQVPAFYLDNRLKIKDEQTDNSTFAYNLFRKVKGVVETLFYTKYPLEWKGIDIEVIKADLLKIGIPQEKINIAATKLIVDGKNISLEKVVKDNKITIYKHIEEKCFYRKALFDNQSGFENLDFINDVIHKITSDLQFVVNLCISLDIHNKIDKGIMLLPHRAIDLFKDKKYNENMGGLYDKDWIKKPDADKHIRDFFVECLDECDYYLKYGKKIVKRQMINIVAKNEFLPKELFTKKEYDNYDEEEKIRTNYTDALRNFEYVLTTWKNNITENISGKIENDEDAKKLVSPDSKDSKSGVQRYVDNVVFTKIYEYIQFIKIQEDQLAKNRSLASDNFKLRTRLRQLEEEKKNGNWKTTPSTSNTLNQPLWRLRISEELNKKSPLFRFAELVAGTLVKNTATLFKINIEDSILEEIKKLDKGVEDIQSGAIIDQFVAQINDTALRPIFLRCLLSAKDSVDNMFIVVNLSPLSRERLMDIGVAFAALVGVYIVQEEETSKTISTTKNDKSQLDQTIFRRNLELRSALQKRGWKVNSTPADDARMMKKNIF